MCDTWFYQAYNIYKLAFSYWSPESDLFLIWFLLFWILVLVLLFAHRLTFSSDSDSHFRNNLLALLIQSLSYICIHLWSGATIGIGSQLNIAKTKKKKKHCLFPIFNCSVLVTLWIQWLEYTEWPECNQSFTMLQIIHTNIHSKNYWVISITLIAGFSCWVFSDALMDWITC